MSQYEFLHIICGFYNHASRPALVEYHSKVSLTYLYIYIVSLDRVVVCSLPIVLEVVGSNPALGKQRIKFLG